MFKNIPRPKTAQPMNSKELNNAHPAPNEQALKRMQAWQRSSKLDDFGAELLGRSKISVKILSLPLDVFMFICEFLDVQYLSLTSCLIISRIIQSYPLIPSSSTAISKSLVAENKVGNQLFYESSNEVEKNLNENEFEIKNVMLPATNNQIVGHINNAVLKYVDLIIKSEKELEIADQLFMIMEFGPNFAQNKLLTYLLGQLHGNYMRCGREYRSKEPGATQEYEKQYELSLQRLSFIEKHCVKYAKVSNLKEKFNNCTMYANHYLKNDYCPPHPEAYKWGQQCTVS